MNEHSLTENLQRTSNTHPVGRACLACSRLTERRLARHRAVYHNCTRVNSRTHSFPDTSVENEPDTIPWSAALGRTKLPASKSSCKSFGSSALFFVQATPVQAAITSNPKTTRMIILVSAEATHRCDEVAAFSSVVVPSSHPKHSASSALPSFCEY